MFLVSALVVMSLSKAANPEGPTRVRKGFCRCWCRLHPCFRWGLQHTCMQNDCAAHGSTIGCASRVGSGN